MHRAKARLQIFHKLLIIDSVYLKSKVAVFQLLNKVFLINAFYFYLIRENTKYFDTNTC